MNAPNANRHAPSFRDNVVTLPARSERRERDFGIGYGNSSGYASERRYANDWGLTRFRCA
jgi:hypothetical protein